MRLPWIDRAEHGSIDADLGGGLIKQRVDRNEQGRSGGFRMIVANRAKGWAIFLFGFAKNEQENISPDELAVLRELAKNWLAEGVFIFLPPEIEIHPKWEALFAYSGPSGRWIALRGGTGRSS
jgi:hypothetical protein